MPRPILFRFSLRWLPGGFIALVLFAVGLAVVNAYDYLPFSSALRRIARLDQASLQSLGEACARYEKAGHSELSGDAIPPEFRALKPVRVNLWPGSSDLTLLDQGDSEYVFLRVTSDAHNQTIESVSCGHGAQRSQLLWTRNPDFILRMNPVGRILTVSQGSMASRTDWIVRPEEILVINRPGTVGGTDEISARIPLSVAQRESIEAGARAISAEHRGHLYDGGAIDGTWLRVSFTANGSRADDFGLSNTWRSEVGPLLDSINQVAGKDHQINFHERMHDFEHLRGDARVLTWQEVDRRERGPLPWWCLWPQLLAASDKG